MAILPLLPPTVLLEADVILSFNGTCAVVETTGVLDTTIGGGTVGHGEMLLTRFESVTALLVTGREVGVVKSGCMATSEI